MNRKRNRIIYYLATGLLTVLMLLSAGMYFLNHEMVAETFSKLGYPSYIIYPLAIAKILGLIAIWSKKSNPLKEWAYAGFFFDFVLALSAHLHINDGEFGGALVAIILLLVSYVYEKKLGTTET
ncbi:DoxX family protein [uncultured Eudoraea sp.]|uniref:DoxX family protein n=1 Tax=uncultured Eudoraea sp. TaxID=1035614 RepID=UPI002619928C|nr:DoxX family protein [uncultured Eudoraea sp.]